MLIIYSFCVFTRFCPSVFFYLTSVVPAIWFMELHEMEKRITAKQEGFNTTTSALKNETSNLEELSANIESLGVNVLNQMSARRKSA